MKGMSLTRTRLRVAVRVMGYYKFGTPYRGCANHQFTAGHDFEESLTIKSQA